MKKKGKIDNSHLAKLGIVGGASMEIKEEPHNESLLIGNAEEIEAVKER